MRSSSAPEREQSPQLSAPPDDAQYGATSLQPGNIYSNIDNRNNNSNDNNNTYRPSPSQSEFTVIWQNLTYKVDSRRWYTRAKERFFRRPNSRSSHQNEIFFSGDFNPEQTSPGERVILNQVCGDAKSRQLTAILGPSGAGKSSLLNCLFQNRTAGTTGRILVESRNRKKLKVCFIPQKDYLNEWLTVREDLIFVSRLKLAKINGLFNEDSSSPLPSDSDAANDTYVKQTGQTCATSLIDHEANAFCVAELLGLSNCLDVTIKNISGGQKKRLSIARELMSKPDILILDEPTTGLDSLTCYKTIMVLRDLAQHSLNPMAVVVTIHQPQREVFNLFDKTYFISNNGRVIYDGSPKRAVETIQEVAMVKLPSPNYNPASFLIEVASDELQSNVIERLSHHQKTQFSEKYDSSYLRSIRAKSTGAQSWKLCAVNERNSLCSDSLPTHGAHMMLNEISGEYSEGDTNTKVLDDFSHDDTDNGTDSYFISHQLSNCLSSHSNNFLQSFRHVFILTHRSWLSVIRNPTFTRSRFAFHTLLPLLMLLVFGTSMGAPNNCPKLETQLNINDMSRNIKNGIVARNVEEIRLSMENISFFFILMYGFGINIISCTASFYPLTMHMFKKETINGLYSPAPYFIGQMLSELPLEIFFPSISILLSYPLSGQLPSYLEWRMFSVAYIVFLVSYVTHSLGLLCGSIFVNNVSVAVLLGQSFLLPFVMLSGFIIRPTRMAYWMRKFSYMSPFKHGVTGILSARYGFNVCDCDEDMLPEDGQTAKLSGMSPNVRHVIEYMFPKGNSSLSDDGGSGGDFVVTEMFDQLAERFMKAQTFALDIKSCDDVKPYLLHVFDVEDGDLFVSIGWLLFIIVVFKLITFSIMKSFPYRIN